MAEFNHGLQAALAPPQPSRRRWIPLALGASALAVAAPLVYWPTSEPTFRLDEGLSPAEQVRAVYAELKRRNPRFPMVGKWRRQEGQVISLEIPAGDITDMSPVAALSYLGHLGCGCGTGNLKSLKGLRSLRLTSLECVHQQINDLSPLVNMPLKRIEAGWNDIANLRPLASLPITELMINANPVSSLAPIAGLPLVTLGVGHTTVTDWDPLARMPLKSLAVSGTGFSDFRVLESARLEWLNAEGCPVADWTPLDAMPLAELMVSPSASPSRSWVLAHPMLRTVNGRPKDDYLR